MKARSRGVRTVGLRPTIYQICRVYTPIKLAKMSYNEFGSQNMVEGKNPIRGNLNPTKIWRCKSMTYDFADFFS